MLADDNAVGAVLVSPGTTHPEIPGGAVARMPGYRSRSSDRQTAGAHRRQHDLHQPLAAGAAANTSSDTMLWQTTPTATLRLR